MPQPELSVVIPAYNEERVIASTIQSVVVYLGGTGTSCEVIIVDDGSTDATVRVVQEAAAQHPGVRLLASPHLGKGGAVKQGVLSAQGRSILFMDADSSTRIEEWAKFAPWLSRGFQVVIGSRKMPGAEVVVRQPVLREAMGKVFTWLTNQLLTGGVSDITCGFKAFETGAAREIFGLQRMHGWGFDAEILFIARRRDYGIKEVPVVWADDASTKVRLGRDALGSFQELLQIRLGAWRGWYQPRGAA